MSQCKRDAQVIQPRIAVPALLAVAVAAAAGVAAARDLPSSSAPAPLAAAGARMPVATEIDGNPGATAIATSGNGGRSWRASLVPGAPKHWNADLIDPRHWRLTDGTRVLATDDAGRHWRTKTPAQKMKDSIGTPLTLNFLSPRLG